MGSTRRMITHVHKRFAKQLITFNNYVYKCFICLQGAGEVDIVVLKVAKYFPTPLKKKKSYNFSPPRAPTIYADLEFTIRSRLFDHLVYKNIII